MMKMICYYWFQIGKTGRKVRGISKCTCISRAYFCFSQPTHYFSIVRNGMFLLPLPDRSPNKSVAGGDCVHRYNAAA